MELLTGTSFNIELSLSGFLEDNPDGTLSKAKMLDMYSDVLSIAKANMFVDQIFTKFDKDSNGTIDFKVSSGSDFKPILRFYG